MFQAILKSLYLPGKRAETQFLQFPLICLTVSRHKNWMEMPKSFQNVNSSLSLANFILLKVCIASSKLLCRCALMLFYSFSRINANIALWKYVLTFFSQSQSNEFAKRHDWRSSCYMPWCQKCISITCGVLCCQLRQLKGGAMKKYCCSQSIFPFSIFHSPCLQILVTIIYFQSRDGLTASSKQMLYTMF